jgi:Fe-S cluster biogenesis protein NfuA
MKEIDDLLNDFRESLQADGYDLTVDCLDAGRPQIAIVALEGACEECLLPRAVVERILLNSLGAAGVSEIELVYPGT